MIATTGGATTGAAIPGAAKSEREDLALFRRTVRRFVTDEIAPRHEAWEHQGHVDRALYRRAGEAGILCAALPEEYGGAGGDFAHSAIVAEEVARSGASGVLFYLHSDIVAPYLLHYGSEELKRRWLPRFASGDVIGGLCMSEPGAGSDLRGLRTTVRRDRDDLIVDGQKIFISNGQIGDVYVVACRSAGPGTGDSSISLVLVEADRPGFQRGRALDKIGMHAQDTSELFFDQVRVPAGNMLGAEGSGFGAMVQQLPQERLLVAIVAIAAAEAAIDWTVDYVSQREAFGEKLSALQNTRFRIAEMATEAKVGRVFVDWCVGEHVAGRLDAETASMAKLWLSEMQGRVVDGCVQLHGGYGYMREYPIARAYADARVQRIYGGTSEIMKEIIARGRLGGRRAPRPGPGR